MKNALITGAGSGIGQSTALALAASGFRVGLGGRRIEPLVETVGKIQAEGGQAWHQVLDIRQRESVDAFIRTALSASNRIDLLVNSAGIFEMRPFGKTDPALWDEMIDINLNGVYRVIYAAWPYLGGGQVINIGSVAGVEPYPGNAAYAASKYGLVGLSAVLALEGKERGIRVHLLNPGNTQTPLWHGIASEAVQERMLRPEQVAEMIRWLANSPQNVTYDAITMRPSSNPWEGEEG